MKKTFHISDHVTQRSEYVKAKTAEDAITQFFAMEQISEKPMKPVNQTGIKSLWDARFVGHNCATNRALFYNREGYAFDSCNYVEYKL